jgi:hypothetical protein
MYTWTSTSPQPNPGGHPFCSLMLYPPQMVVYTHPAWLCAARAAVRPFRTHAKALYGYTRRVRVTTNNVANKHACPITRVQEQGRWDAVHRFRCIHAVILTNLTLVMLLQFTAYVIPLALSSYVHTTRLVLLLPAPVLLAFSQ